MRMLVCAGYARPGQTGWQLLDSFHLDLLLDLAYAEITNGLDPEQREEMDSKLDEVSALYDEPSADELVEVKRKSTGEVVQISEARLAQLRRNAGGSMGRPQ